jgi:putative transposase
VRFINDHQQMFGVEPVCRVLSAAGVQIAPSTYYAWVTRPPSKRQLRDAQLTEQVRRVHQANYAVYGARKVWRQLRREGVQVARCTVERLMRQEGLTGAVRGSKRRTTIRDDGAQRAPDLVGRRFAAPHPDRLWVADFTYVATWSGTVYVALVVDAFSRRICGWKADTTMKTSLVLDAIEMALWSRSHAGRPVTGGLVHHSDAGSQYTSFAFTTRLLDAGADASIGSIGDAYDNALAETTIGLFKTELIKPRAPWRTLDEVEFATLEWIDWYNNHRLHNACGHTPPAEYEADYYRDHQPTPAGALN